MRKILALTLLFLSSFGCTTRIETDTPEVRNLLASLTSLYLSHISLNSSRELTEMVLWGDYLEKNPGYTKQTYLADVNKVGKRWTPENSPISRLAIIGIEIDGNNSTVKMVKSKSPKTNVDVKTEEDQDQEVQVDFLWVGSGWLVVDDNILGIDGIVTRALSQK